MHCMVEMGRLPSQNLLPAIQARPLLDIAGTALSLIFLLPKNLFCDSWVLHYSLLYQQQDLKFYLTENYMYLLFTNIWRPFDVRNRLWVESLCSLSTYYFNATFCSLYVNHSSRKKKVIISPNRSVMKSRCGKLKELYFSQQSVSTFQI